VQDALHHVGMHFARSPATAVLAGASEYRSFDGSRTMWKVDVLPTSLAQLYEFAEGLFLPQPSVFFRRQAFELVGPLAEDLHYAMDLDLWLRFARRYAIKTTPIKLSWMRQHDGAKTFANPLASLREVEHVLRTYEALVPAVVSRSSRKALQMRMSEALLQDGLRAYFVDNKKTAWRAVFCALHRTPFVVGRRIWLGLLLRLTLPTSLKSRFLQNP
jgi:hypothetical protein